MPEKKDLYLISKNIQNNLFFPKKNYLTKKGYSPDYIKYRILRPVFKLYYKLYKINHPETPWTSQASIVIFDKILDKTMRGLEYGSGKSTLFFTSKLNHLTSIEHHKTWYDKINKILKERNINNVDYRYIPQNSKDQEHDLSHFSVYANKTKNLSIRSEYINYFEAINNFPDNHFDFILIDGRARVECSLNAIKKLKKGGIFVLDNSERSRYKSVLSILESWPTIVTTTGLTDTTIWFKP